MKQTLFPRFRPSRTGSTLVISVFVIAVVSTLIGAAVALTSETSLLGRRSRDVTGAQALADGALEGAYRAWRQIMLANRGQLPPTSQFVAALNTVSGGLNARASQLNTGFRVTSLKVWAVNRWDNEVDSPDVNNPDLPSFGPQPGVPGFTAKSFNYRAQARVSKVADPSITVTSSRYFEVSEASLFQAMMFFQNDLELHPGPQMTIYGLVHTNANFYACAGVGGSLTFTGNVSFTGNTSATNPDGTPNQHPFDPNLVNSNGSPPYVDRNGYAEAPPRTLGDMTGWVPPVYTNSRNAQLSNTAALDPLGTSVDGAVPADQQNANTTGLHEIIERPVPTSPTNPAPNPTVPDPQPYVGRRLFNTKPSVKVLFNGNDLLRKVRVYDSNNQEIVPTGLPLTQAGANLADQVLAAVTPSAHTPLGDIYDAREQRNINVDTIDLSKLVTPLANYGVNPDDPTQHVGVVLYVADVTHADPTTGESSNQDAVRIKNGGTLPDAGLTVASDGALYMQGDYNTGTTYNPDGSIKTQPSSNTTGDVTTYTVNGYTQKPAAVAADAVMILSNNWNDASSRLDVNLRVATPTTVNTAIMSGQVLTDPASGTASGGAHNFPRFLENWGGQNLTYYGSMCQLYASKHFTGSYGNSNVYSPPKRRWFYDNQLRTKNPPGNGFFATSYNRGFRWVRY